MSEQDEINAERDRLNHDPEEGKDWSPWLDSVVADLAMALYWGGDQRAFILKAKESIDELAEDNPYDMLQAVINAWRGDSSEATKLYAGYIRTYAEAHLPELVEHFQIETGEKK